MALLPIQGASEFFKGASSTYTNATGGGVWSSGNSAIVTINSSSGLATGIAEGQTQIIYTVGSESTALNIQINQSGQVSNGFNAVAVYEALKNEVLWLSQGASNSGRYYQPTSHPILDEKILKELCNTGAYTDYPTFLESLNKTVIMECVNAVFNAPQMLDKSKLLFMRSDVMLVTQVVQNQNPPQFVGLKLQLASGDYATKVSNLMLFFNEAISFPIYLYNDFDAPPVYIMTVTTKAYQQVIVNLQNNIILNYLTPTLNKGGIWYLGYYQADIIAASPTAKAIYYPMYVNMFGPVNCWSFSAGTYTDGLGQRNFNRNVVGANNLTYGMNLEMSTMVDATNTIVENPSLWDNLLLLKMTCKVIEQCSLSIKTNSVQRAVQSLGGMDDLYAQLNGRPYDRMNGQAKIVGLYSQVNDAVDTVKQAFEPSYTGGIGLF